MLFDVRSVRGAARFSECGLYRYWLTREWDLSRPKAVFIGLNPSTADANVDDPTMRRIQGFCRRDGYGAFTMLNLYGIRSTDPKGVMSVDDPVGPDTDHWIAMCVESADAVVCCWGYQTWLGERPRRVFDMARESGAAVLCFGMTKTGQPRHPLYLKSSTRLIAHPWLRD